MQIAVERRPGSKIALTITVEPEILQQRTEQLFQKFARKVAVPGFRPGKAPRRLIEERINSHLVQKEAIDSIIESSYREALQSENIQPLEQGDVEDLNIADDMTLTFSVIVSVRPEVTLAPYSTLKVNVDSTKVNESGVDTEIDNIRGRSSDFNEVIDQGIETGDYVTIDYTMMVNGEPYPEGDTTGYPLEIGTDTFFEELNEGLLGVKPGETTTVTKSYPEDYSNADLAGKTASFEITVQQVRRLEKPELTDEWAQLISQGALKTVDELRERILHNLQAMASQSDREHVRNEIVRELVAGAQLEIPDTLVEEELDHLTHELEHQLSKQRTTLEEYAESMGKSVDDVRNEQQLLARDLVRRSLVLQEVAQREKLFVTEEELNATIAMLAPKDSTPGEVRKELEKSGRLDSLANRLFHEKVLSFLEGQAEITIDGKLVAEETLEAISEAEPITEEIAVLAEEESE